MTDDILDKLGFPVFKEATVAVSVLSCDKAVLKYGKVNSFINGKLKINGGNLGRAIERLPKEVIVIIQPYEYKDKLKEIQ